MLLVFCDQQIDGILWNRDFADGVFRFRARDVGFARIVASGLLADRDGLIFDVQVRPLERHQLALAQAADEFQIEHRQDAALLGCGQIGPNLLWRQNFHFVLLDFRRDAVVRRISDDQALCHRAVERVVQHRVDAANCGGAQPRLLALLRFPQPAMLLQIFVESLQVAPCQLFQWNIPDARRDMQFDAAPVVFGSREPQMRLRVEFIPCLQPSAEGVLVRPPHIDGFRFRNCLCQFFFYLRLRLTKDVLNQPLAGLFVIPSFWVIALKKAEPVFFSR